MTPQLLCHLCGDYVIQNHWMAMNKTKRWWPAIVHATTYMLPFLLLTQAWLPLLVMWATHLVIDRFRLAAYWQEWWGVGCSGTLWMTRNLDGRTLADHFAGMWFRDTGEPNPDWEEAPPFLKVWLLIIIDNTLHLTINYLSLSYL